MKRKEKDQIDKRKFKAYFFHSTCTYFHSFRVCPFFRPATGVLREKSRLATCSCVLSRPHAYNHHPLLFPAAPYGTLGKLPILLVFLFPFLLQPRDHTGRDPSARATADFLTLILDNDWQCRFLFPIWPRRRCRRVRYKRWRRRRPVMTDDGDGTRCSSHGRETCDATVLGVATCLTREGNRPTDKLRPPSIYRDTRASTAPWKDPGGCAGWASECASLVNSPSACRHLTFSTTLYEQEREIEVDR